MNLPNFPLASWEVPRDSGIPLVAPADLKLRSSWRDRESECLIRSVYFEGEERLFFREINSNEVGNWLLPESHSLEDQAELAAETYESDCITFCPETCWRLFHLDGARYGFAGMHRLLISHDVGEWQFAGEKSGFVLPQWGEQFTNWRASQVGRMAHRELDDLDSEIRCALDWLHLDEAEKQSSNFGASSAKLAQIKTLMAAVLRLQTFLPTEFMGEVYTWRMAFSTDEEVIGLPTWHRVESENIYMDVAPDYQSSPLHRWGGLFSHYLLRESSYESKACYRSRRNRWLQVTIAPPTAHEKMEAAFQLRRWCEEVGAQAEFAELVDGQVV